MHSMLSVALVEPEIPPNTGNIARLCAATNVPLHIVGVTGFRMDDRALRRAGLDYWPEVQLTRHKDLGALYRVFAASPLRLSHDQGGEALHRLELSTG